MAHSEFGHLDITFSQPGTTLDVTVAAAENDKQQALASALNAGERATTREGQASAPAHTPSAPHRSAEGGGGLRDGGDQSGSRESDPQRAPARHPSSTNRAQSDNASRLDGGAVPARPSGIYA